MLVVPAVEQLERIGRAWADAQRAFNSSVPTGAHCARFAELGIAAGATARRLGRSRTAEQVMAQTLAALRDASAAAPTDLARHLAFARVLEAAALHHEQDARAAFDALRAAATVLAPFADRMDPALDPIARLALGGAYLRPLAAAARMLDDAPQRRAIWRRCWEAALRWADASRSAPDHAQAVEWVVLLAFELAVDELETSAGSCLERCEELRPHLEALSMARAGDAVSLLHRSAFLRLWADAWHRLGELDEAQRALDECERILAQLDALRDADSGALSLQRAALERDRSRLSASLSRRAAAATGP